MAVSPTLQWHWAERSAYVVTPVGELNAETMPELRSWVAHRLSEGVGRIVIDLSHVSCVDDAALAGLVICARAARAAHARLVVRYL